MAYQHYERVSIMHSETARSMAQRYGSHWFDADSMRFFRSHISESTWTFIDGETTEDTPGWPYVVRAVWRFVSSERFVDHLDPMNTDARRYTVREMTVNHREHSLTVETVGEFQQYASARTAQCTAGSRSPR